MRRSSILKGIRSLLIGVALVGTTATLHSQNAPISEQHSGDQSKPAAKDTEQPNNAAGAQPTPAQQVVPDERAAAHPKAETKEDRSEFWSAKLTDWLLAAFTFALVVFTGLLYRATARLWEATREQAELTRTALIHTQRAFVFVKEVADSRTTMLLPVRLTGPPVSRTIGWKISLRWENSGATPTKDLITYVSGKTFDKVLPEDFSFEDIPGENSTPGILGPQAVVAMGDMNVPMEIMQEIYEKKTHFYMWGWAEYNDVFDETDRHRTEFCYKIEFTGEPFPEATGMVYRLHHKHNGADKECMKKPRPYRRTGFAN
jgi:hypothetical protein